MVDISKIVDIPKLANAIMDRDSDHIREVISSVSEDQITELLDVIQEEVARRVKVRWLKNVVNVDLGIK